VDSKNSVNSDPNGELRLHCGVEAQLSTHKFATAIDSKNSVNSDPNGELRLNPAEAQLSTHKFTTAIDSENSVNSDHYHLLGEEFPEICALLK
jgi:hypothetical protein